jgi:hypothetical protein
MLTVLATVCKAYVRWKVQTEEMKRTSPRRASTALVLSEDFRTLLHA